MSISNNKRNNRTAGHAWERECLNLLKHLFPNAKTSRNESKTRDDQKVDLCFTEPYNIQCKTTNTNLDYEAILKSMPDEPTNINVIFHKKTKKSNTRFLTVGKYVILQLDDFLKLIDEKD